MQAGRREKAACYESREEPSWQPLVFDLPLMETRDRQTEGVTGNWRKGNAREGHRRMQSKRCASCMMICYLQ